MKIDDKLFAHIHNDTWLSGTKLQGKTFRDTIALFTSYVNTLNDLEKNNEVKALSEDLNYLKSVDDDINSTKNISEISQKIAQKILRKDRVLIPGGWVGNGDEPGHALIYCFETNEAGQLLFKVYNSGAGLNFHKIISEVDKERYCTVQQFSIENITAQENYQEKLAWFLGELLKPQQHDETKSYNENVLYQKIFPKIAYLEGDLIAPPEGEINLTAGQRSGTCAEKILHQLAKISHADKKAYKRFMYNFKKHTLDLYLEQVITDGREKELQVQEQIELAIDNMARILEKSDYFSKVEKNKAYAYLSEKKSILSQKKETLKQSGLFDNNAFNRFYEASDTFTKPLSFSEETVFNLAESKTKEENLIVTDTAAIQDIPSQPPPQDVKGFELFLTETKTLITSNPEFAIDRLEKFFLKLPIPLQYQEQEKESILDALTELYKIYIETYPNFSQIITSKNIVCALSFITICSQVGNIEDITQKRLYKLLEQEKYNPFLGSQEVLCDTRLQEIRNLYKKYNPIELKELITRRYVQMIKDCGVYDSCISLYQSIRKKSIDQSLEDNKDKKVLYVLEKFLNQSSVFFGVSIDNILREKCAWQNKIERSICAGLSGLNTNYKKPHVNLEQRLTVFDEQERTVASNLSKSFVDKILGNEVIGTPSRFVGAQLCNTQAIEATLLASTHCENMASSNAIQLGDLDTNSTDGGLGNILRSENSQTWLVRELMHLRTSKKAQLKSTLVFFKKNLSLLAKEDIQYYLEKNIFEPNLLMEKLSESSEFLQELHDFLIQSANRFSQKNKPDKTAIFLLHLAIKVNFYANEMAIKGVAENLQLIQKQLETYLKHKTADTLVLRELHTARLLLLANTLQKRAPAVLTEAEIQQYFESLLVYHHYPIVREYQDALYVQKFKEAVSFLSRYIPKELTPLLKKNLETYIVKLLELKAENYIFEFSIKI